MVLRIMATSKVDSRALALVGPSSAAGPPMSDPSYPDALPAQYRLHWYVLERVLGQGGFGITYLARDTNLDQLVAIKEYLPTDVATRRPDASVRSRTEE